MKKMKKGFLSRIGDALRSMVQHRPARYTVVPYGTGYAVRGKARGMFYWRKRGPLKWTDAKRIARGL